MSSVDDDVWVNLRPCGCRHLAVAAGVPRGVETMQAKITQGWSLNRLDARYAARLPDGCDTCRPVRQERWL
jgi:hypothetical protein